MMNSSQSTLRIISGMEFPALIGVNIFNPPLENTLIKTCSNESAKYHITQYGHIVDHEGLCKYLLKFCERAACIMNSLGDIIK